MPGRVIAIDGPAASGKSSVSRGVAARLGFLFVSSGHFYRTFAWGTVRNGISPEQAPAWITGRTLEVRRDASGISLFLDGEDATPHLSEAATAAMVSPLAAVPAVRDAVNARLRALAAEHDLVMEGRDIGSVVFPKLRGSSTSMPLPRSGPAVAPRKGWLTPFRNGTASTRPAPPHRSPCRRAPS